MADVTNVVNGTKVDGNRPESGTEDTREKLDKEIRISKKDFKKVSENAVQSALNVKTATSVDK